MSKITKTINIYLKKLKIFQKSFTFKVNLKIVRTILRTSGKCSKSYLVNLKSKKTVFLLA